jgi:DNA-binding Lrp family transcriptional regulator
MSRSQITVDELLREIKRIEQSQDGITTKELANKLGVSEATALRRIRELHARGLLKVGFRRAANILGNPTFVPVYMINTRPSSSKNMKKKAKSK